MSSEYQRYLKRVIKKATALGWRYKYTAHGHVVFYSPDKVHIVTASSTATDGRAMKNLRRDMAHAGLD